MIQIKINGGTPKSGKSLCHTCKFAAMVKGQNCEEYIRCSSYEMFQQTGGRVPFKVAECSVFHPVNIPWMHEMEQMAWIIEARKRGPVGFSDNGQMEVVIRKPNENNDQAGATPTSK